MADVEGKKETKKKCSLNLLSYHGEKVEENN